MVFLTESNISFEEIRIPMFTESWPERITQYSPVGRVPVLLDADITVWDSTAIIDCARESLPDAVGWPVAQQSRALARKAREFIDAVQGSESLQQWIKAVRAEPESISFIDELVPAESSPSRWGDMGLC